VSQHQPVWKGHEPFYLNATPSPRTAKSHYDAPRRTESDDVAEDSLDERKERRNDAAASIIDVDEADTAESFELPGADLSGEELSVWVVPKQADEFTCSTCFLVHHRHRYCVNQQGREPLRPAVDSDVVDLDATLGEKLFEIPVGQAVPQVPAHR